MPLSMPHHPSSIEPDIATERTRLRTLLARHGEADALDRIAADLAALRSAVAYRDGLLGQIWLRLPPGEVSPDESSHLLTVFDALLTPWATRPVPWCRHHACHQEFRHVASIE